MAISTEELMKKVGSIRILTRKLVDDRLSGDYHSSFKGQGIEFDEIREYVPGDDVRSIDWNVTARTGLPQVKRFSEERELTVMFIIDVSGSQSFGSARGKVSTKAERAAEIACLLALTSIRNQDNVGLMLFSDRVQRCIPPRKGRNAVARIVREVLAADRAEGGTDISAALEHFDAIQHRKSVVFLISDFQDTGYEKRLAALARRHDLVCCTISDPAEETLPDAGLVELEDPETGETAWVDLSSRTVRESFATASRERRDALQAMFRRAKIDSMDFSTAADPIDTVRAFFRRRARKH